MVIIGIWYYLGVLVCFIFICTYRLAFELSKILYTTQYLMFQINSRKPTAFIFQKLY